MTYQISIRSVEVSVRSHPPPELRGQEDPDGGKNEDWEQEEARAGSKEAEAAFSRQAWLIAPPAQDTPARAASPMHPQPPSVCPTSPLCDKLKTCSIHRV